jgi:hypothetical protein
MKLTSLPVVCAAFALAACSSQVEEGPEAAMNKFQQNIAENLPPGWAIGIAKDTVVAFTPPTAPEDILVWKTNKVLLRKKGGSASEESSIPEPVNVYFTITPRPYISPEEYPDRYATNKAIKAQHDYWNKTVSHIPRNTKGEPNPRGVEESEQVGRYMREYPKLPPYDTDLPTHYFGKLAFKLRDWRTVQEPEDRKAQTEMNTAYVVITKALTVYKH